MEDFETLWDKLHPAPFTLFQAENGRWGTKDANGDVYNQPIYYRVEEDDKVTFNDGCSEVCDFNPEEGMSLICYGEPWWWIPFELYKFPEQYNHYIIQCARSKEEVLTDEMRREIAALPDRLHLDDDQRRAIDGLGMMLRWEDTEDDDQSEAIESEWFSRHPEDHDGIRRIAILAPLMERDDIPRDIKRALWYANFRFISYFCI